MKKAAKKSAPAKTKAAAKLKQKAAAKPAKKAKAAPKKAKSVAKNVPAKVKSAVKKTTAVKAKPPVKSKPVVKLKPAARPTVIAPPSVPVAPPSPPSPPATPSPPAPTLPSSGAGTRENPWVLKTPPGGSEFQAFRDDALNPPALVVRVGSTELRYHLRCITDLHEMLKAYGDWMLLGAADEQKPVVEGTVESWARSPANPVGGWYGLKSGLRGRFGVYVPPVMEVLGLAEVEHFARDNRMRAK